MTTLPEVTGYLANGERLVRLQTPDCTVWLDYDQCGIANPKLAKDIAERGLPLFQQENLDSIVALVADLTRFDEIPTAQHVGWNGSFFAQHDGTINGAGVEHVHVLFEPQPSLVSAAGTLADWKRQVAIPVSKQPFAAFAMMAMLLAPLLRFMPGVSNPFFEFAGARGSGMSTMLKLAGSAIGSLGYGQPLRDVQSRFDELIADTHDYPALLNEVSRCLLTTTTKPKQAELFARSAFDLPGGSGGRVVLMAAREPLHAECGLPSGQDDIITLTLLPGENIFSSLPEGVSAAAYSDDLLARAANQHGTAYPALVDALTAAMQEDENALKATLAGYQARFAAKAAPMVAGDGHHQASRAFAAAYAAGRLAVDYGILPPSFKPLRAALAAWTRYTQVQRTPIPFRDRLEQLIADGDVVQLHVENASSSQAEAVSAALGSVIFKPSGRIVRIWYSKIEAALHGWATIRGTDEVRVLLQPDGNNLARWGHMAPGLPRSRDFQFKLPPAVEGSLFAEIEGGPTT